MSEYKKNTIVHYDEIALKRGNRDRFESILQQNILRKLEILDSNSKVVREWGRMYIYTDLDDEKVSDICKNTPGVATYGVGISVKYHKTETLEGIVSENADIILRYVKDLEKKLDWQTFRTTVHRVDKNYPSTSQEYEKAFGEIIFEYYKTKNNCKKGAVNLTNPDIEIVFEMLNEKIVFYVKMNGIGGLPVSSSGKAIVLLSGGFDSPVAAYMLAKRGVRIVGIHFHGIPKTSKKSLVKVRDIAKVLSIYTGSVDLYVIPIISAMEVIAIDAKQDSLRLILLRRLMNRVAERIAERIGGGAIITGESVGQVASQTLENMRATAEPVSYPVLRPLCGMNKNEIIAIARKIGTHDISVRPHDDTCVEFVPKKPETRANLQDVHRALESYDEDLLIEELLKKMSIESF